VRLRIIRSSRFGCANESGNRELRKTEIKHLTRTSLRGMFWSAGVLTHPAGCSEARPGCALGYYGLPQRSSTLSLGFRAWPTEPRMGGGCARVQRRRWRRRRRPNKSG
jgi:hypothetical protein